MRFVVCVLLLSSGACLKPSETKSPDALQALEFQRQLAAALDARIAECAQVPKELAAGAAQLHPIGRLNVQKATAAGRLAFSAADVGACLDSVRTIGCDELPRAYDRLLGPCAKVLTGKAEAGSDCYSRMECGAGLVCTLGDGSCPGKCAKPNPLATVCEEKHPCADDAFCVCIDGACKKKGCVAGGKVGSPCGHADDPPCEAKLYCPPVGARSANTCQPQIAAGGSCPSTDACKPPLRCAGLTSSKQPGQCKRALDNGAACTPGKLECGDSSACVGDAKKPPRCLAWGATGAACGPTPLGEYYGCINGYCETIGTAKNGACRPYKKDGEPCDPNAPGACGPGQCDRVALKCVYGCAER